MSSVPIRRPRGDGDAEYDGDEDLERSLEGDGGRDGDWERDTPDDGRGEREGDTDAEKDGEGGAEGACVGDPMGPTGKVDWTESSPHWPREPNCGPRPMRM